MIRLNVSEEKLQSGDLIDVVKQLFWYQIFWKDSFGADIRLKKLQEDMYKSNDKAPIFYNRKKYGIFCFENIYITKIFIN